MSKYTKGLKEVLAAIKKQEDASNKGGNFTDFKKDFWKPTIEKDQERVEYLVRFLPNPDSIDGTPYVSRPAHMIKFASGNYIYEPCPKRAFKSECPICARVNEMYKSGNPAQENIASSQCAKKRFFQNVLVLEDPRDNGANVGKVFAYEYGDKIQTMCIEAMKDKRNPVEYYDPIEGADFEIVITWEKSTRGTFQNYDKSKFCNKSTITLNGEKLSEDEIDAIIEKSIKLNDKLLSEKCFKTASDLDTIYKAQGYVKKEGKTEGGERVNGKSDAENEAERLFGNSKKAEADKVVDEKPIAKKTVKDDSDDFKPSAKKPVKSDEDEDVDAELQKMLEE